MGTTHAQVVYGYAECFVAKLDMSIPFLILDSHAHMLLKGFFNIRYFTPHISPNFQQAPTKTLGGMEHAGPAMT